MFDTHCHLQFPQYDSDREEVISRARSAGIKMICVGTDLATSQAAIDLAQKHDDIWAAVGLHPNDNLDEVYVQMNYEKLLNLPRVVAIGEVGLDYFRSADKKELQMKRFRQQIDMAVQYDKPLIIHCREAHEDMLTVLPDHRGVIHSFNGPIDTAMRYIEKGYHIGLNGIITFSAQYEEMVRQLPLSRMLLETDAPYLAPVPYRGQRNEPAYIKVIAQKVVDLKEIDVATLEISIDNNVYDSLLGQMI